MNLTKKIKVLIIGPFLPPYGGVSVHIDRLIKLLQKDFEFSLVDESKVKKQEIYNIRSINIFKYFKNVLRSDVIYIHSGTTLLRFIHLLVSKLFFKKSILTLHGFQQGNNKLFRLAIGKFYQIADKIVVVNSDISHFYNIPLSRVTVKEAFLPPGQDHLDIPDGIKSRITRNKDLGKFIISGNAYSLKYFNDQDLYGLDLLIELANRLKMQQVPFLMVFVVSVLADKSQILKYKSSIEKYNLEDEFILLNENLSFIQIMELSDIIIRPTNTDGDSLTVREALYLGKKVIASDVVQRPVGTIEFKNRNLDDLERNVLQIITNFPDHAIKEDKSEIIKNELHLFYKKLIENCYHEKIS